MFGGSLELQQIHLPSIFPMTPLKRGLYLVCNKMDSKVNHTFQIDSKVVMVVMSVIMYGKTHGKMKAARM
jgi:hypothetical protein